MLVNKFQVIKQSESLKKRVTGPAFTVVERLMQWETFWWALLFSLTGSEGLPVLADQTASQMGHSAMMQRGNGHSPEKMDFVFLHNKRKRLSPAVVEHNVVCFTKQ